MNWNEYWDENKYEEVPECFAELEKFICCGDTDRVWDAIYDELLRCSAEESARYLPKNDDGGWHVLAYILADYELTSHGGSIYGAWLTEKGKESLEYLKVIKALT